MTQGTTANRQGAVLEDTVASVFARHGFQIVDYRRHMARPGDFLIRRVPYTTIYGHQGKTEFVAVSTARDFAIRIECKWQQVAGSVDEKFPYLYLNCIEAMPEREIIILLDGGGCKLGAADWLQRAIARGAYQTPPTDKVIHLFNTMEFIRWANARLR